ncbi:MAG: PDDEXK nuclease domain-containing protein [Fusobacteriaceae bacterium]|jgi:predicted nuclease of restriction endonuclease-like (RecB) superfamily|nr:PDDEXK nuclease domain-containing protein [Fusobacteriaceae bacterium]
MSDEIIKKTTEDFIQILSIIGRAHENMYRAANREFISMYWDIGKFVSEKVHSSGWGKSTVKDFSEFVQSHYVGIQGFSASNIWRMRQFYETYKGSEQLAVLTHEINWTNNLKILARAKTDEAREFYLIVAAKNRYSTKELERQIDSMLFERTMISDEKNKLFIAKNAGLSSLRDNYVLEFLDIPHNHKEHELRKAIIANLKDFILEFGKDFTFVGEEYRIQVGNSDFRIDLRFFNRALSCLVAIELKVGAFMPEHLGQLEFYLEAIDSDVRKENENPSVGLILCADKDDAVVEYALRRSISPALVANYQLHLPNKKVLQDKLRELTEIAEIQGDSDDTAE